MFKKIVDGGIINEDVWLSQAWGGSSPLQFFSDQLILSQPGGHIIPIQYYKPPRIFGPCDGPALQWWCK